MGELCIRSERLGIMDTMAINGADHASEVLTKWLHCPVRIHTNGFKTIPLNQVSDEMGSADRVVVAVITNMVGSLDGYVVLAFPEEVACKLVDLMIGQTEGTTTSFDEMAQSALLETGNIVSSSFINSLGATLGVRALPSPPYFVHDMAGAFIQPLFSEQAAVSNTFIMIAATFEIDQSKLDWWLYVVPFPKTLEVMEALLT